MHPLKQLVHNSDLMNSLAKEYGTPLYIYDASRIRDNVNIIQNSLSKYFDKFHICYAIKSNSNPHLIKTMLDAFPKMGGDCSSPVKYMLLNLLVLSYLIVFILVTMNLKLIYLKHLKKDVI